MNKLMKRITLLIIIFILAAGAFWLLNRKQDNPAVYVTMEDGTLPIITMEANGSTFNNLFGYVNQMNLAFLRDTITPLPGDRKLKIHIQESEETVTKVSYEIRSLDGSQLIERQEVESQKEGGEQYAVLPITNLISEDTEYSLAITLSTKEHPSIYYYTRIFLAESTRPEEMIAFAKDFSNKTFDSDTARELVPYLESSSSADNSSLGMVNIKSSFHQITWGDLDVTRVGEPLVFIKELGHDIATIQLKYQVTAPNTNGREETYDVTEAFVLKWASQRFYLMSYERTMNQIFEALAGTINGRKIHLGITSGNNLAVMASEDGKHTAFVCDKALWSHNLTENQAIRIFTFRDGTDDIRANHDQYDIKIISIDNDGNALFMVYGYMNRGEHEGEVGISCYQYIAKDNTLEERFYIPTDKSYQMLCQDIGKLSYVNQNQMCYFMFGASVYAIDLIGREFIVVVEDIENKNIIVSDDSKRIAWVKPNAVSGRSEISIMNLDQGTKQTITAEEEESLKVLGFVDEDFIYGIAKNSDLLRSDQKTCLYAVEIIGDNQTVQTRYEKAGIYVTGVKVQDALISLSRAAFTQDNQLEAISEDSLIRNEEIKDYSTLTVSKEKSDTKKSVYYISLKDNILAGKSLVVTAPQKILMPETDNRIYISMDSLDNGQFYAYRYGRLEGIYLNVTDAIQAVYEDMGNVVSTRQNIIWWRSKKLASVTLAIEGKIVYSPEKSAVEVLKDSYPDKEIINAAGCSLNQVLAFVSDGKTVIAMNELQEMMVIYGYDQYNVMLYHPVTKATSKMGLNDGAAYFGLAGNRFYTYMD